MMADEYKELLEHLLTAEDVLKSAEVDEQVEVEQERPEDFASMWKATNSHNNVLFQLSQKATMPSYLAQLVGTI